MIYVGVDPGLAGGIARLDDGSRVWDMPTREVVSGGKKRRRVDAEALARVIADNVLPDFCQPEDAIAFVEAAQATPQMGVSSAFGYGQSFGLVLGVLAHLGVPVQLVGAAKWKRAMGIGKRGNRMIGREIAELCPPEAPASTTAEGPLQRPPFWSQPQ